jgi:type IV pilus assembly protein PilY1
MTPHAPVRVVYDHPGGVAQATIITPASDGSVRAIDAATTAPLWTFIAPEVAAASARSGLLTDVRVLRFDANGDGVVDVGAGDKVWLYFGLRRAGPTYYALDISDRTHPHLLWRVDGAALDGLGDAWSTPSIARVRIAGARQNGEHFVVIVGGGFDTSSAAHGGASGPPGSGPPTDGGYTSGGASSGGASINGASTGGIGNDSPPAGGPPGSGPPSDPASSPAAAIGSRIFILDAQTGHLLWEAGPTTQGGPTPDLQLANMTSPIPSAIAVLDTDADDYADRMYAIDLIGRVWRFDIWNGHSRATLVTGGVLADVRDPRASAGDAPQFSTAPDVALIQPRGGIPYFNIAVGSGNPLSTTSDAGRERFYAIRDRLPFDARSQADYESATPILFADLIDISAAPGAVQVPPDASGWTLALDGSGEKVVASAITVNGVVMFTTFQRASESDDCVVSGSTRVYAVRADTAQAAVDLDGDGKITRTDLSQSVPLVTEPAAVAIRLGVPNSTAEGPEMGARLTPECLVGSTRLKACVSAGALVRTFWQRRGVK